MGKTLDNFGLGLSIVVALLYWHSFVDGDRLNLSGIADPANISINTVTTYIVLVFLTQIFIFCNLVFANPGKTTCVILRTSGWVLIFLGYLFFLYLSEGFDLREILLKPGGGISRFD